MSCMIDLVRREHLRRRIRSEVSTADRLCEAVTNPGLRKRIAVVSINLAAVEVYFLNAARLPAHDEDGWLDVADHWLALHTTVLRGLEFEAFPNDAAPSTEPLAAALGRWP